MSLLICLLDLSISDKEVSKSPSIIVDSSIAFHSSIKFLPHIYQCSVVRCIHIKDCYVFLDY